MRALRASLTLLLASALWLCAPAAFAEEDCTQACRDASKSCRERCVKAGGSSEQAMVCRADCLSEDDACRCDCGESTYCDRGNKGQRGCGILVAQSRAPAPKLVSQRQP